MRNNQASSNSLTGESVTRHEIALTGSVARMSSLEIAELTGKRHDNVKRTIETLAERGVIEFPQIEEIPSATKTAIAYLIGKRDSYVIVAQLSPEFTAALVDRWQALESQLAPQVPQTLSAALRLAADQAELIEQQTKALAIAAPKAEFVDRYVESSGSLGFRQLAKLLNANERQLRQLLLDKGLMYYLGGVMTPYAQHIDAGRFEVKAGTCMHNSHAFTQAKFTPKGVQYVAGLWAAAAMKGAAA